MAEEFDINMFMRAGSGGKLDPVGDFARGYGIGQAFKQQRISKKNQKTLGGLRRKIVGLDNSTPKEQSDASDQMAAQFPKEHKLFMESWEKADTQSQRGLRAFNQRRTQAGSFLQGVTDEQLPKAMEKVIKEANAVGHTGVAEYFSKLLPSASSNVEEARLGIEYVLNQGIAADEGIKRLDKLRKEQAEAKITRKDTIFDRTMKLSQRVKAANSSFTLRTEAINTLSSNAELALEGNNSAQVAVIFNYMKILDPPSTVREGEVEMAKNTENIPNKVWNTWLKAKNGQVIGKDIIQNMMQSADATYWKSQKKYTLDQVKFQKIAKEFDIDYDMIVNKKTGVVANAPKPSQKAITALRQNNTEVNRTNFKNKFGSLPKDLY
jgi:hypothetical protein